MTVRIGRRLRAASVFLLCVAASVSLSASVPLKTAARTVAAPQAYDTVTLTPAALGARAHASGTCPLAERTSPANSFTHPSVHRTFIFVEDTTPPSSNTLKTARLQTPTTPQAPPLPASPALRSSFASPANRQRAP